MKYTFSLAIAVILLSPLSARAEEEPYPREQCVKDWKAFMEGISNEEADAVCQCIEDEKAKSPVPAEKGSTLSGPSGLDNAGPWPAIMQNCLFSEKPLVPKKHEEKK